MVGDPAVGGTTGIDAYDTSTLTNISVTGAAFGGILLRTGFGSSVDDAVIQGQGAVGAGIQAMSAAGSADVRRARVGGYLRSCDHVRLFGAAS